jgi:hypothetical protein
MITVINLQTMLKVSKSGLSFLTREFSQLALTNSTILSNLKLRVVVSVTLLSIS